MLRARLPAQVLSFWQQEEGTASTWTGELER